MSGTVRLDPLFLGLTRPATLLGVSFIYFILNSLVGLMVFITTSDFRIVPFSVAVHMCGVALTKKEPLAVEMLLIKIQKFNKCPNKIYHGGRNSYDMF